jgi:murein L,D-transpeptidase YcbB/YkuD
LSEPGRELLLELARAAGEGWRREERALTEIGHLHRLAYPAPFEANGHATAELEWQMSRAFASYASRLLEGRVPWAQERGDWHRKERSPRVGLFFDQLGGWGARRTFDAIARSADGGFISFGPALAKYRTIARAGGWPRVSAGAPLGPGDRSQRVRELRRRLAVTGDSRSTSDSDIYDAELDRAVRAFQERHGLAPDGRVGSRTLEALNVPVEDRIRQLEINLERFRWLPPDLGTELVWVNIPEFRLRAFRDGREVLSMPVVVGAARSPTPTFHEKIVHAVLNPYWNVPESIALDEVAPKAKGDPGYLRRAQFELLDERGSPLPPEKFEADLLREGRHRIRRKPGPFNDLGRIKFMLPNPFRVYLHDTPARHLFERASRAFSHGCIRLGRPLELARYLFDGRYEELESGLGTGEERVMRVARPVPAYIVYFTAWQDGEGAVNFRDDVYGRDARLSLDLERGRSSAPSSGDLLLWPSAD